VIAHSHLRSLQCDPFCVGSNQKLFNWKPYPKWTEQISKSSLAALLMIMLQWLVVISRRSQAFFFPIYVQ
jgi:hypothetical protein